MTSSANEIFCPKCGAVAPRASRFWGYSKPYCSACGWNAELARSAERRNLEQFPIVVLFVGLVLGTIGYFSAAYPKAFILLDVAVVAYTFFHARSRLRALESSQPDAAPSYDPPTAVTQGQAQRAETDRNRIICDRILALGKPRRTKLNMPFRAIFVVTILVVIYSLAIGPSSLLVFALILGAIGVLALRAILRDRKLLQNGDVAIAVITSQMERGRDRDSYICYQFEDPAGGLVTGDCRDGTRKFCKDMQTVVLFNPEAPSENVTLANATVTLIDL